MVSDEDQIALGILRAASETRVVSEAPDLHSQLESILHAVFRAEADARLDDLIDLSLGIPNPKSGL